MIMPNAPLFSVIAVRCEGGAVGMEIYAFPFSVGFVDDGRSVTVTVRAPYCTKAPGELQDVIHYAEMLHGDRMAEEEIHAHSAPWVKPLPWSIEYPEGQPIGMGGRTIRLRAPRLFGSLMILISQEGAMVTPHDVMGQAMDALALFLNADGSTPGRAAAAAA